MIGVPPELGFSVAVSFARPFCRRVFTPPKFRACLTTRPVRGPGRQNRPITVVSCRPPAITRRLSKVFFVSPRHFGGVFAKCQRTPNSSYSFPGVVHRLSKGAPVSPAAQTVNNAVAARRRPMIFRSRSWVENVTLGSALVRTSILARSTSIRRLFDQSRNPNADTHTQVPTPNVSHYTNCAPRSLNTTD